MKISMLDTVETTHMLVLDLEKDRVAAQSGLAILSEVEGSAGGMSVINYILLLTRDAVPTVPDRLGEKLVRLGFAKGAG